MSAIRVALIGALAFAGAWWIGCDRGLGESLTRLIEAQKLAADMRIQLHRSSETTQQAIMSADDEAAASFVRESEESTSTLAADQRALGPLIAQIGTGEEKQLIGELGGACQRVQDLDRKLLALAVENTNVKAQRLAFGPARAAANELRDHLNRAASAAPAAKALRAELLATRVQLAVREIQAVHARHIAEADDAAMTELEHSMAQSESSARSSLEELSELLGPAAEAELDAAHEQLDRFSGVHQELLKLSRANSNVHSLAVALGEKRTATAACDAALAALQDALAKHGLQATR